MYDVYFLLRNVKKLEKWCIIFYDSISLRYYEPMIHASFSLPSYEDMIMINQPSVQTQFRQDGCRNANTGSQDCTCGKATLHTCSRRTYPEAVQ